MGIDPRDLPPQILEAMSAQDRKRLIHARLANATTDDKSILRQFRKLEREEQRTLANWLNLQESQGILSYDWSATHKRATNRPGMPDFRVYRDGRTLLAEMKLAEGTLSAEQRVMHERLAQSGTSVAIWHTAEEGIREIRAWLWQFWRLGYEQSQ